MAESTEYEPCHRHSLSTWRQHDQSANGQPLFTRILIGSFFLREHDRYGEPCDTTDHYHARDISVPFSQSVVNSCERTVKGFCLAIIAILATTVGVFATEVPTTCPSEDPVNKTIHIAHESDCTKFYKCLIGKKHEMTCPEYKPGEKLCFNPKKQICDWPWNVKCCNETKHPLDPHCPTSDEETTALWPHPYSCNLYYTCKNGIKSLRSCNKGELFDSELLQCRPSHNVKCNEGITCPPAGSSEIVVIPHDCDCTKYYTCVDGELIRKHCPAGEKFDYIRRECILATEAVCNIGTTPVKCPVGEDKDIPHETDCSSYYRCKNGIKHLEHCRSGLYFDEIMGMCTWWENVDCGTRSSLTTSSLPGKDTTDEITLTECPLKGSHENVTLPHECSCVNYYLCKDSKAVLQQCEEGTVYDREKQACEDSKKVNCEKSTPELETTPIKVLTNIPTDVISITSLTNGPKDRCPPTGRVKIADETDCTAYWLCKNGEIVYHAWCQSGHFFNPQVAECDLITESSGCNGTVTPTQTTPTQTTPTETTPTETTPELDPDCLPLNCKGTIRFPDTSYCSKYIQCVDGRKETRMCPEGLKYNPEIEMCDLPQNVNCDMDPFQCTIDSAPGKTIPHECQCNMYYQCEQDRVIRKTCGINLNYDCVLKRCISKDRAVCCKSSDLSILRFGAAYLNNQNVTDLKELPLGNLYLKHLFFILFLLLTKKYLLFQSCMELIITGNMRLIVMETKLKVELRFASWSFSTYYYFLIDKSSNVHIPKTFYRDIICKSLLFVISYIDMLIFDIENLNGTISVRERAYNWSYQSLTSYTRATMNQFQIDKSYDIISRLKNLCQVTLFISYHLKKTLYSLLFVKFLCNINFEMYKNTLFSIEYQPFSKYTLQCYEYPVVKYHKKEEMTRQQINNVEKIKFSMSNTIIHIFLSCMSNIQLFRYYYELIDKQRKNIRFLFNHFLKLFSNFYYYKYNISDFKTKERTLKELIHLKIRIQEDISPKTLNAIISKTKSCIYLLAIFAIVTPTNILSDTVPTECPPGDPVGSEAVHLAHPTDCTKFYKCSHGNRYELNCPEYELGRRLYFNPQKQVCDWPSNIICSTLTTTTTITTTTTPTTTTTTPTTTTTTPTTTTTTPTTTTTTPTTTTTKPTTTTTTPTTTSTTTSTPPFNECNPLGSQCPSRGKCNLRDESGDCTAYYQCQNGQKFFRCCRPGHHFNPQVGECDTLPCSVPSTKCPTTLLLNYVNQHRVRY
ncbi:uncharacterized protein LOC143183499 [Calliopsis andreniformis]|uniref:uncharacterized protein LOC143183499 n=1 Tax=Calliopsis andreniformis TaxID=337506 RepID=UPI003FCCC76C